MTFHLPDILMFSFQAAEITDISGKKCNAKHRKDVCIIQHKTFVCPGSETYLSAMLHAQEFMILNTLHFCIQKIYKLTKPRYIDLSSRRYVSLMSVLGWFSLKLLKNDCQRRVSENMYVKLKHAIRCHFNNMEPIAFVHNVVISCCCTINEHYLCEIW